MVLHLKYPYTLGTLKPITVASPVQLLAFLDRDEGLHVRWMRGCHQELDSGEGPLQAPRGTIAV